LFVCGLNDLYCVEWGVKLYSLTHSLTRVWLQDCDTDSMYEQATSTFCARNATYRGNAAVSVDRSG